MLVDGRSDGDKRAVACGCKLQFLNRMAVEGLKEGCYLGKGMAEMRDLTVDVQEEIFLGKVAGNVKALMPDVWGTAGHLVTFCANPISDLISRN